MADNDKANDPNFTIKVREFLHSYCAQTITKV